MIFLLTLLSSLVTHGTLACSHTLTDAQGYVGYSDYAVECSWTIVGGPGTKITIDFLKTSLKCGENHIQAVQGSTDISEQICSQTDVVVNAKDMITVKYWSRPGGNSLNGEYRAEFGYFVSNASAQCGGLMESFVITPPKSNGLMLNNLHCLWAIIVPPDYFVFLSFPYMNLESRGGACVDRLQVKQVINGTVDIIGSYCGTYPPETLIADGNIVFVEVTSDNDYPSGGFIVQAHKRQSFIYKEILTSPVGIVEILPRDPSEFRDVDKDWYIAGKPGNKFKVIFTRLSLDPHDNCLDKIEFARGRTAGDRMVNTCDFEVGTVYEYDAHEVYVNYFSGSRSRGKGFSFTYLMEGNDACGGLFFSPTGVLSFPTPAGSYDDMTLCSWAIVGLPSATVTADIVTNDMEMSDNCSGDSLQVYDGYKWSSPLLLEVCGNLTGTAVSTGIALHAVFESDASSTSHQGFTLHWRIEYEECGGPLTGKSGMLSSNSRGPSEALHCEWLILVKFGDFIEVNFTNFDLLYNADCDQDYVEFRNGDTADSPLLLRTCVFDTSKSFVSISHQLYIIYHSSASSNRNGVTATYTSGTLNCGGTMLLVPVESIAHTTGGSETCIWAIGGAPNSITTVLFESFNLQTSVDCNNEFFEIYDGNSTLLLRTCGTELPSVIHGSSWNQLIVIFRSFVTSSSAFSFIYHISGPGCGTVVLGPGTFESPHDEDGRYFRNIKCSWLIHGQPGQKVVLYNRYNDLPSGTTCSDHLDVHQGIVKTKNYLEFCDSTHIEEPVISVGRSLLLDFYSGANSKSDTFGFIFSNEILNDPLEKEILTHSANTISASRDGSTDNIHLQWQIVGRYGARFSIYFTKFFLDTINNCSVDYFEIRSGTSASNSLIVRSCYFDVGTLYEYDISMALITFHSESSSRGDGFILGYSMVAVENCGGLVTTKKGNFSYPGTGEIYQNFENCRWLFLGLEGETVHIDILETAMDNCPFDNLTIYDGPTDQDNVLAEVCKDYTPTANSSTNVLSALFLTNVVYRYLGFRGTYSIEYNGCGGATTETSGEIRSLPRQPATDLECHWSIIGKFDSLIQLTFTGFDLMSDCSVDYIRIRGSGGFESTPFYSLCYDSNTVMIYTVPGQLYLSYHSGSRSAASGISASYTIINPEPPSPTTTTAASEQVVKDHFKLRLDIEFGK